ncbi:hypothetical protein POJ06DRAFT_74027 [Lipomyces tetrasporus]|uniref:Uncharacterized protein n=1 Tax=Lipomyces tetrasporus TaxID=54092 RepID=A0AAD7QV71_9ASCO|nr:uncharacterized protein POJ06DRAFT_74027 [Lipomyces tetrasporus]KAJ8101940.1 hypothetical protein POJ06DRAFT_74027 [Lipomyces tetrasporus]
MRLEMESAIEASPTDHREIINRYCSVCIKLLEPDHFVDQYGKKFKTCNRCRDRKRKSRKGPESEEDKPIRCRTIRDFIGSLCREIHHSQPGHTLTLVYNLTSDLEWKAQTLRECFTASAAAKDPDLIPAIFADIIDEIYNFTGIFFVARTRAKDKAGKWRLTYLCAQKDDSANRNTMPRPRVRNTSQRDLFECGGSLVIAQLEDRSIKIVFRHRKVHGPHHRKKKARLADTESTQPHVDNPRWARVDKVLKFMCSPSVKNSRLLQDFVVNELVDKDESLVLAMEGFMANLASAKLPVPSAPSSQLVVQTDVHHGGQQYFGSQGQLSDFGLSS